MARWQRADKNGVREIGILGEVCSYFRSAKTVGRILLLKGPRGTGMTFFARQIAEALNMECIPEVSYISKHISRAAFYELVSPQVTLKADWAASEPRREVPSDEYDRLLNWVRAEDDREDHPATEPAMKPSVPILVVTEFGPLVQRPEPSPPTPTAEVSDLPELDAMRRYVQRCPPIPALLVVDTIDELSEYYGVPSARLLNALRIDLVDHGLVNVICIQEKPADSSLDSLSDGIIVSGFSDVREQREWRMTIKDLRGHRVEQPTYAYRLCGVRIECAPSRKEIEDEIFDRLSGP